VAVGAAAVVVAARELAGWEHAQSDLASQSGRTKFDSALVLQMVRHFLAAA